MTRVIFDIETNGLLDTVTKIWCIVTQDVDTKEIRFFSSKSEDSRHTIQSGVKYLMDCDEIIGHYVLGFDVPCIKKFYPWFEPKKVTDTLVLSRLLNPDRGFGGKFKSSHAGHSVEAWAPKFNLTKVEVKNNDFSIFDDNLEARCRSDVEIQLQIYLSLLKEAEKADYTFPSKLEHKVQEIIQEQEANGWLIDYTKCESLISQLTIMMEETDLTLLEHVPYRCIPGHTYKKIFLKDGGLASPILKWLDLSLQHDVSGVFSAVEFKQIDLNSSKQVKEYLLELGWVPDAWNYKKNEYNKELRDSRGQKIPTSPRITPESLESIRDDFAGILLKKRFKIAHRVRMLKGILDNKRPDGRVAQRCNTIGAVSHRMTHGVIANIPKPAEEVFFGKECRSIFIAPEGRVLVDCDAAGCQARIFASWLEDDLVITELLEGDIHQYNQDKLGLATRQIAKNTLYAFLFGAGANKLSQVSEIDGNLVLERFNLAFPTMEAKLNKMKQELREGCLKAIDGRLLYFRNEYSAFNLYIQSAEAIVMKTALCFAYKQIKEQNLDAFPVGNMHDEMIFECKDDLTSGYVSTILETSIEAAGRLFKLRCPLAGTAKVGKSWDVTH